VLHSLPIQLKQDVESSKYVVVAAVNAVAVPAVDFLYFIFSVVIYVH